MSGQDAKTCRVQEIKEDEEQNNQQLLLVYLVLCLQVYVHTQLACTEKVSCSFTQNKCTIIVEGDGCVCVCVCLCVLKYVTKQMVKTTNHKWQNTMEIQNTKRIYEEQNNEKEKRKKVLN